MTTMGIPAKLPSPVALFSVTLFLSAALMFAVQPMLGKMLLPLVGGAPSGWLTALAFFQIGLLAGYALAHGLARFTAKTQACATLGLLIAGVLMLPVAIRTGAMPHVDHITQVLAMLFGAVSVPYVALATVSSGMQRLFGAGRDTAAQSPYFLYAASNAGSFAGLLAYPALVEPFLPLTRQAQLWSCGYGLLVLLVGGLILLPRRADAAMPAVAPSTWRQRGAWLLLAFIPSSLSMGLTALITSDLGSVPLFWVMPLALYLLTFVIAFGRNRRLQSDDLDAAQLVMAGMVCLIFLGMNGYHVSTWSMVWPAVAAFFVTALWCHLRLASLAPPAGRLTEFYLWLALGGALGGIFNAFLAPLIFAHPVEFLIVLFGSLFLHRAAPPRLLRAAGYAGAAMLLAAGTLLLMGKPVAGENQAQILIKLMNLSGLMAVAGLGLAAQTPRVLAVVLLALTVVSVSPFSGYYPLDIRRNFFGVMKIDDATDGYGQVWRRFTHGGTIHGIQKLKPEMDLTPVSYYAPVRAVMDVFKPRDVGVIGLGAGVLLCYQAPDRHYTMYEIDPVVRDLARQWFSFIKDCGEPRWGIGDGRLELARDTDARYDLLVADAFSSDSIPVHLLTREAVELYLSRLKPGGIVAFNISNRYYDVSGPLAAIVRDLKAEPWLMIDPKNDPKTGKMPSMWMVIAPPGSDASSLRAHGWTQDFDMSFPVWRDDYANLLASMRIFKNAQAH